MTVFCRRERLRCSQPLSLSGSPSPVVHTDTIAPSERKRREGEPGRGGKEESAIGRTRERGKQRRLFRIRRIARRNKKTKPKTGKRRTWMQQRIVF